MEAELRSSLLQKLFHHHKLIYRVNMCMFIPTSVGYVRSVFQPWRITHHAGPDGDYRTPAISGRDESVLYQR